ncbi:hypothetical protein IscW_ISCW018252 [Ixodes scapularis]|uniref:Uncharacterized protein n=1 Tax=Ixodes scapularis TaxID=6945 RepID=B7PHQ9_IXOSC|nr:hypothetical protein IscW_ISCW018252 [Ixodes scapularis]|eukprot:XP_002403379.1 hypothetical protein IscW_ISCW018252 [Ixodes scapularis]
MFDVVTSEYEETDGNGAKTCYAKHGEHGPASPAPSHRAVAEQTDWKLSGGGQDEVDVRVASQ